MKNGKIIAAITVLAMAATATGATTALFNDIETSTENIFEAGTVDIKIGWEESINSEIVELQAPRDNPGTIFNITNITPGDTGEATIEIENNGNPSFLWFSANQTVDRENFHEKPGTQTETVCGPITAAESTGSYRTEFTSNKSVKFEGTLGEDGAVETDVFNITLEGEANETVYVETKSGRFIGTAMLQGEGATINDTSGLWEIKIEEISEENGKTVFTIKIISDGEEGEGSPALSYVEFSFCDPIQKEGYYQLDLTSGDVHEPAPGRADSDLFLAALSHSETDEKLNPSLYRSGEVPERMELEEAEFIIGNDTARVNLTVEQGGEVELALSSHEMVGPYEGWRDEQVAEQTLYDSRKTSFGSGAHSIEVDIPGGYYPDMFVPQNRTVTSLQDNSSEKGELGENLRFILWHDNGDNVRQSREELIFNGTAHQLGNSSIGEGLLLDGDTEENGINPITGHSSKYIGFRWYLPENTGCDVQTDEKVFEFSFDVSQSRHNGNPFLRNALFHDREESGENRFKAGNFTSCDGQSQVIEHVRGETEEDDSSWSHSNHNESGNGNITGNNSVKKLLAYYPLDSTSYSVKDISGNYSGENEGARRGVKAVNDSGFSFDGSDAVSIEGAENFRLQNGTVSAWFRMKDESTNWVFTRDKHGCEEDCGHFSIAYDSFIVSDKLGVRLQNNGEAHRYRLVENSSKHNVEAGEWNHVAVSFGNRGMALYINGELHDTNNHTRGISGNNLTVRLGRRYDGSKGLNGKLDDVRIYNYQLKKEKIRALANITTG